MSKPKKKGPGWHAITDALFACYRDKDAFLFETSEMEVQGGKSPLDGIAVCRSDENGPHWIYVTYGFSELYKKKQGGLFSKYGFELTFRLRRAPGEQKPPSWVVVLLQNLAYCVFTSYIGFNIGDTKHCNGPILLGDETLLHAVIFWLDPVLKTLVTPCGAVDFFQVVAITEQEKQAADAWNASLFFEVLGKFLPFGITELDRGDLMENQAFLAAIEQAKKDEDESLALLILESKAFNRNKLSLVDGNVAITISDRDAEYIYEHLAERLLKGKHANIKGAQIQILVLPAPPDQSDHMALDGLQLTLQMTPQTTQDLIDSLKPGVGTFVLKNFPKITFEITKS